MMIKLGAPQVIWLVLLLINLMINAVNHGKPKEGFDNITYSIIDACLSIGLLIWGGFFG